MEENILVLGDSGTGKTHFAIQLFGRLLKTSNTTWTRKITPENLENFESGFDRLRKGLEIDHTPSTFHQDIAFRVVNRQGTEIIFIYPDYAGEQLRSIVTNRRLNQAWLQRVMASTCWLLFIKLNAVKGVEDIITRGMPDYGAISLIRAGESQDTFQIGDQAFYVELLQMLVRVKEASFLTPKHLPQLTIMLSCWDEYKAVHQDITKPDEALKKGLPMFHMFLHANWPDKNLHVVGLSSTGRKLNDKIPDEDYLDEGPEKFGYWVTEDGEEDTDLTGIISLVHHE